MASRCPPAGGGSHIAVIRLTRGNLHLVERLLAQMRWIMDLNTATGVTLEVVEAARDDS